MILECLFAIAMIIYAELFSIGRRQHKLGYLSIQNFSVKKIQWKIVSVRRQTIIWTNAGILLIRTLGTNFSEISGEIHSF